MGSGVYDLALHADDEVVENKITIERGATSTYVTIPKNARKVTVHRRQNHHELVIGGLKSVTMRVTGTPAQIDELLTALL